MLEQERDVAVRLVTQAVGIGRAVQRDIVRAAEVGGGRWDKDDKSPVTEADLAIQACVSIGLREAFPADPLMGEETSDELRRAEFAPLLERVVSRVRTVRATATPENVLDWIERRGETYSNEGRYWVLDPIDGTKGFLRGEQYAIALALVIHGRVALGVLGCPNLPASLSTGGSANEAGGSGEISWAIRGEGAFRLPLDSRDQPAAAVRLNVAPPESDAGTTWVERVESSGKNKDVSSQIAEAAGIVRPPHRLDSQAKYAVVARGDAALYLRHTLDPTYREKVWDHAAGAIVIEEAGGRLTDLAGRPLDFSRGRELSANRGIVATNGEAHDRVLASIRAHLNSDALA
jgi:HAL2 family 3'(2'),5'-bisphosphate nucleotidase